MSRCLLGIIQHGKLVGYMQDSFIELRNITKYFPGVVALENMSLRINKGEVHGLVGENGAGKSTLIKVLTGVYQPDSGAIFINGKQLALSNPNDARQAGIGCVYQELNIIPELSVTDNIYLGCYVKKGMGPFLDYDQMHSTAAMIMSSLGQAVDPHINCGALGMGVQQTVEIAKSILMNSRLVIMDEPTSSLSENEVAQLMETIRRLKAQEISVIFVSHKLQEIFDICDVVTVIRDGQYISTRPVAQTTRDLLISDMVGRSLENLFPKKIAPKGMEMLRVEGVSCAGVLHDVSFSAYGGEILGLSGLVGAGRTELLRAVFGADPHGGGHVFIKGREVSITSPADAIRNGIAFLTEDRKGQGLLLDDSVENNLHLASIDKYRKARLFIDKKKKHQIASENVVTYKIKTPSLETHAGTLSGGNQQKVVIGKWVNTDAEIYFFDEPTRGIDVAAKIEVYHVINDLVARGKCVIMVSSELPEILGMSDRVLVMRKGTVMAVINRSDDHFNQESIMKAAWGGKLA